MKTLSKAANKINNILNNHFENEYQKALENSKPYTTEFQFLSVGEQLLWVTMFSIITLGGIFCLCVA